VDLSVITQIAQAADPQEYGRKAGKAIALGIGAGLGTIGPASASASSSARSSSR
jgi:F-type H+-transporting ATPase subunit c